METPSISSRKIAELVLDSPPCVALGPSLDHHHRPGNLEEFLKKSLSAQWVRPLGWTLIGRIDPQMVCVFREVRDDDL
jgi:hypothetical protein